MANAFSSTRAAHSICNLVGVSNILLELPLARAAMPGYSFRSALSRFRQPQAIITVSQNRQGSSPLIRLGTRPSNSSSETDSCAMICPLTLTRSRSSHLDVPSTGQHPVRSRLPQSTCPFKLLRAKLEG